MASLSDIEQIRSVEWGRSFLWDVRFVQPDVPPDPFDTWFPAIDIEEHVGVIESHTIEAYNTSIKIPRKTGPKELRLTFLDDVNHTLFNWLDEWINEKILNDGLNVAPLSEAVRKIHVSKLDTKRREIAQSIYLVYPDNPLLFTGNSSSDLLSYSIGFQIVGSPSKAVGGGYSSDIRSKSGGTTGRLSKRQASDLGGETSYAIADAGKSVWSSVHTSYTKWTKSDSTGDSAKSNAEKKSSA